MKKPTKRTFFRIKLFLVVILLTAAVFAFDARIRPMIQTYACNQAANQVTKIVNEAVFDELSENKANYSNLIALSFDDAGMVTSLQTNMLELNRMQSSITKRVITRLMAFDSQTIRISLGAIIGGPIFSGRGPNIEIKLIPANFIKTKIDNKFMSAGINQTRHQVTMDINLTVTAVLPGYRSSTAVATNVVLAETVIVGHVPEAYTLVGDGSDMMTGILEDYRAEAPPS